MRAAVWAMEYEFDSHPRVRFYPPSDKRLFYNNFESPRGLQGCGPLVDPRLVTGTKFAILQV